VLFPLPDGPSTKANDDAGNSNETPRNAATS